MKPMAILFAFLLAACQLSVGQPFTPSAPVPTPSAAPPSVQLPNVHLQPINHSSVAMWPTNPNLHHYCWVLTSPFKPISPHSPGLGSTVQYQATTCNGAHPIFEVSYSPVGASGKCTIRIIVSNHSGAYAIRTEAISTAPVSCGAHHWRPPKNPAVTVVPIRDSAR